MELSEPGSNATRGWSALNDQASLACWARLLVAAHGRSFVDGFILKSQGRRGVVLLFKMRPSPSTILLVVPFLTNGLALSQGRVLTRQLLASPVIQYPHFRANLRPSPTLSLFCSMALRFMGLRLPSACRLRTLEWRWETRELSCI